MRYVKAKKMRKMNIFLSLFMIILVVLAIGYYIFLKQSAEKNNTTYSTVEEYYHRIDYSCNKDSDCVIKDVGSCCGLYPKCVNKQSVADPDFVSRVCAEDNLVGSCGFPAIDSCECVDFTCRGFLTNDK